MRSVVSVMSNWWSEGLGGAGHQPDDASAARDRQRLLPAPVHANAGSDDEEEDEESESDEEEAEADKQPEGEGPAEEAPFVFLPADSEMERIVIQRHRFKGEKQVRCQSSPTAVISRSRSIL